MKIAIACDHGGYLLKQDLLIWMEENDIEYEDFGCFSTESVDYPVFAEKAARAVADGSLDLEALTRCDHAEAKRELLKLSGVGEKVADCVALFGLGHTEAFPIDVWIRRALKENFPKDFDPATLGEYAGLAQQYIFYYARSHGK